MNAPADLREALEPLTDRKLIDRCAALRPAELRSPSDTVQHALCALASRWLALATEIAGHDTALEAIAQAAVPTLKEAFGIAADSAAEMMIVVGDNPTRLKSEAAFAKLCGACPVPASTGVANRHRLFRGGHRQANAALYGIVTVRMRWHQSTIDYVSRRTGGRSLKERHHSLLEAVRCTRDLPRHHEGPRRPPGVTFASRSYSPQPFLDR